MSGTPRAKGCGGSSRRASAKGRIPIRTLSVSILAVAAVAASLIITRGRDEQDVTLVPAGETQPAEQSLAAIRAAGL
ncbi:MAG: hypothetical protein ACYC28_09890 [Longimicrobiales bacterium]